MNEKLKKEEIMAALNERHSPEKQALLSEGRVAIAGLGGLGSNVAYALARIGVGHLHLIDFDVVDITNLNRQQYFMEHLGMYKTDALKSLLHQTAAPAHRSHRRLHDTAQQSATAVPHSVRSKSATHPHAPQVR